MIIDNSNNASDGEAEMDEKVIIGAAVDDLKVNDKE